MSIDADQIASPPAIREKSYRWSELTQMVFQHRRELVAANLIAILGAVAAVPVPLLIPLLVDEVLLNQPGTAVGIMNSLFPEHWHGPVLYIMAVLVLTLILRIFALIFGVWQTWQFTRIAKDVIFHIRRDLLHRLERISMSSYETMGSGTVASHLVTDLEAVDTFVSVTTSKFLVAALSIIGTAVVLLWINWPLALFILFLNPLVIYFTTIFGRKVKHLKKRENSAFQAFQESLEETLDAIQQIRASNRERHYIHRIIDKADNIRKHSAAFTWKSDAANRLSFMVFLFGFDIFRGVSMFMVLWSDLTIGEMLGVYAYLWFMMGPVQEVLNIQYAYNGAQAALGRINAMMQVDLEPAYPHNQNPFSGKKTVSLRLQDLKFAYGDGPLVLNGIELNIAAGEKVAFVGASGGGKTTLVQILLGLYPVKSGHVYFDDVPVEEIGMDIVRDHVATVLQHPALLNDSVRINLTLGRDIDDEKLWQALEIAQLKNTVMEMDQGLETLIGRFGVRLSGGQRQRLAIARMVLTDPSVVILDEATSALDTTTEGNLHTALQAFLDGRTTIIIAHRLSAVKQADRVLVFEDGLVVEEGRHDELIENNGLYSTLYGRQEQGSKSY
ncbi:MAG: ABC transporter ATP-binding protein/permease [Candidatus Thiodiazotropha lotti]|uniref:ABC transporter ATP-binding protein n=1 Tax=Candidatus Thiodiazotropha endoloripes TaxID=1818881 RepID=A0A1E2UTU1_9GAMM|nr:ABC transporter ATP-binding protein [Candidatus Thiodiazotropha endoloripes]MCG7900402.1 ABC transporter ATP-binding protein/permease [Candidatus Thiodiazotropha weberae]MCG7990962.1 ABC transporter ATP-binding protein/permease [Candidatus Thiodiazotropha lotti]MCG7903048.1 ABC transporter ATP-binding protein/permease [Candidatus Thiodiazotropha weberae]MCG7914592.1 ABC transporter ATP-binding protein/permease [Candidatus Thiodiazotropha weberae]MCG8001186.1 ABC transporter ATP-binding prot